MTEAMDFTTGSIPKKLIRFMIPILGALILQAMYGAVDLFIVGRFGTTAGISGVSTGSSIMNMFTFTVAALTTALTVVMGQYIGMKREDKLGRLLGGAICFFALVAIVLGIILVILANPIARLMQAPKEALGLTTLYIRICGAGFIFIVFYNLISAVFRGMGDSVSPLLFVGIACVVNIVGDLILVAGLHMNTAGAAIATVGAQAVSVLLSLLIMKRRTFAFTIRRKDIGFHEEIPKFVKIGLPLSLQELLTNVTFLALCAFVNRIGLDASSGYGVAQKIQSIILLFPAAIMQSMASVVAQNVGAKLEERARNYLKTGIAMGLAIGLLVFVSVFFKGDLMAGIFTEDQAVIGRAFEFLQGFAPESIVTVILFAYMGYFNGHGKSMFVMTQSLLQSFLVRLPLAYIMSIRPNASLRGVGLSAPCATVLGIILCFLYDRRKMYLVKKTGSDDV